MPASLLNKKQLYISSGMKIRISLILLLVSFTINLASQPAKAPVFSISDTTPDKYCIIPEATFVSYYNDPTKKLTIAEIRNKTGLFSPAVSNLHSVLDDNKTNWLHFNISSLHDKSAILFLGVCTDIEVFITETGTDSVITKQSGTLIPRSKRDIKELPDCIQLDLKGGKIYDIYAAYSQRNKNIGVAKMYLLDTNFVWRGEVKRQVLILGMFTGSLMIMLLFYLAFFSTSRDKTYLLYAAYILCIIGIYIQPQLYIHNISKLSSEYPEITSTLLDILAQHIIVFYALFMRSFVNTPILFHKMDRYIKRYIFIRFISAPIIIFTNLYLFTFPLSQIGYLIDIAMMLYACLIIAKGKTAIGKYLVIGTGFFGLMSFTGLSITMYWLFFKGVENMPPMYHLPDQMVMIGISGELILFSIGLGMRTRLLSYEKRTTQEKLITQLKANEQLQIDINKKLEEKVNNRTSEIMRQNSELNLALRRNELLASISRKFLTTDFENAARFALKEICMVNEVERSYLFFFSDDRKQMFCYGTWNIDTVPRQLELYDEWQPVNTIPETASRLLNGEIVNIPDVNKLEDGPDKRLFQIDKTRSIICVPIIINNQSIGFAGFDHVNTTRVWSENEIITLRISTEIIGGSYVRLKAEEQIRHQHEEIVKQKNKMEESYRELQRTQSQLVQSEKMASLGLLTAGVAHEINNPINFVSSNIDPLQTDIDELMALIHAYETTLSSYGELPEHLLKLKKQIKPDLLKAEIADLVNGIAEGANRTKEIVLGLRNFSRVDELELKQTDIHEALDSTLMLLQNKIRNRISIVKQYTDLPKIKCYPGKLNQVFMNILTNAVQAIDKEGSITISTALQNKMVSISIKDTGKGMTEETRKNIFDPFFTTKNVGEGTGLGLSISYGIIEKHQGKIQVLSEPGKGSEFIIMIPVDISHE